MPEPSRQDANKMLYFLNIFKLFKRGLVDILGN